MDEGDWLVERFQTHRAHLHAVAYRMLGSLSEADDAVQEAWLRLSRAGSGGVDDLGRWLTTVVARVCLDMLRSRAAVGRSSRVYLPDPIIGPPTRPTPSRGPAGDAVGLALSWSRRADTSRAAGLVLHDTFAVPLRRSPPSSGVPGRRRQLPAAPAAGPGLDPAARRRSRPPAQGGRCLPCSARNGDLDALVRCWTQTWSSAPTGARSRKAPPGPSGGRGP